VCAFIAAWGCQVKELLVDSLAAGLFPLGLRVQFLLGEFIFPCGCVLLSLYAAWEVGGRCCGRSLWLAAQYTTEK
jgi:hypothetical protein